MQPFRGGGGGGVDGPKEARSLGTLPWVNTAQPLNRFFFGGDPPLIRSLKHVMR